MCCNLSLGFEGLIQTRVTVLKCFIALHYAQERPGCRSLSKDTCHRSVVTTVHPQAPSSSWQKLPQQALHSIEISGPGIAEFGHAWSLAPISCLGLDKEDCSSTTIGAFLSPFVARLLLTSTLLLMDKILHYLVKAMRSGVYHGSQCLRSNQVPQGSARFRAPVGP